MIVQAVVSGAVQLVVVVEGPLDLGAVPVTAVSLVGVLRQGHPAVVCKGRGFTSLRFQLILLIIIIIII